MMIRILVAVAIVVSMGCTRNPPPAARPEVLGQRLRVGPELSSFPATTFWALLASENIPVAMSGSGLPGEALQFSVDGSVEEVLNAFVDQHSKYSWRIDGRNRIRIELRDPTQNPLCSTKIASFAVEDVPAHLALETLWTKSPLPVEPLLDATEFSNLRARVTYSATDKTLCEITEDLADLLPDGGAWAVNRVGENLYSVRLRRLTRSNGQ